MKTLLTSVTLAIAATATAASINTDQLRLVTYQPTEAVFSNPERGFFHHLEFRSSGTNEISASSVRSYRNQGITLVYSGYILDSFRYSRNLSQTFLDRVRRNMEALRSAGLKTIVRFYYSGDAADKPYDVALSVTQHHIEQLQPIFTEYADVIAVVEAGFVGLWGEWHTSDCHIPASGDYTNRRAIVESLAAALPAERFISLRTPAARKGVLGESDDDRITAETAYDGSLPSRIGLHNDCFLANESDAGTFTGGTAERAYAAANSLYSPVGGETCSAANSYTEEENARTQLATYHWSYLNADYHTGTLNSWENTGFLDEVKRRLGYRFVLTEGYFPESANAGGSLPMVIELQNVGWAAPYNPRAVEIVLVNKADRNDKYTFTIDADPRRWKPETLTRIESHLNLDVAMTPGEYTVYLNLPDPAETLHDRYEYSIRTANDGTWEARTGMNRLTTITVTDPAGINEVEADALSLDDESPVYDMSGRIVGRASTITTLQPGVYIYHGLKIKL